MRETAAGSAALMPPRLSARGHPDRPVAVEEMVEPRYHAMVRDLTTKGISEEDAALAIESLAQAHLDTIIANKATEAEIAAARRDAGLPELGHMPSRGQEWMVAAG